jgi:hypothetical protein
VAIVRQEIVMSFVKVPVWMACALASLAVHVGVMSSSIVPGWHGATSQAGEERGAEVLLRIAMVAEAKTNVVGDEWAPPARLEAMPVTRYAKPRLLARPVLPSDDGFDEAAYVASNALTVRPSAAQFISVPYPESATRPGVLRAQLILFIDEQGVVVKARVRSGELPPDYQRAALGAFEAARFHPGQIGETPVRSKMVVEVEFDSGRQDIAELPRLLPAISKP